MISMNQIWDDSIAFIRRELILLATLAMATLYVYDVAAAIATAMAVPGETNIAMSLAVLVAALWSIVGQLAIISLVLRPGQSVGEAMSHGASRLGKIILIVLLFGFVATLALLPVVAAAIASGVDPNNPDTLRTLPGWVSVLLFVIGAVALWLGVRLSLLNALVVDRNPGVVEAVRSAFGLTRGIASRLLLVVLLYALMVLVLGSAVRFVAGSLFAVLGAALDSPFAATVMTAMVTGLVSTAMSLIATVFLATLYRHVSGRAVARAA